MPRNFHVMSPEGKIIYRLLKNILIVFLFLFSWRASFGQYDTLRFPIPMQNGIISYHRSFEPAKSNSPDVSIRSLPKWISTLGSEYQVTNLQKNEIGAALIGNVLFRIDIPETGNYFWIKARILIYADHDSTRILVRDFYEKPIEKGVTNDYSKIEYRWWDFRNAKPWSLEDESLFKGLDQKTRKILDSFSLWINH